MDKYTPTPKITKFPHFFSVPVTAYDDKHKHLKGKRWEIKDTTYEPDSNTTYYCVKEKHNRSPNTVTDPISGEQMEIPAFSQTFLVETIDLDKMLNDIHNPMHVKGGTKKSKRKITRKTKKSKRNNKNKNKKPYPKKMIGGTIKEFEDIDCSIKTVVLIGELHTPMTSILEYNNIIRKQKEIINHIINKCGIGQTAFYSESPEEYRDMVLTTDTYSSSVVVQYANTLVPTILSSVSNCDRDM